MFAMVEGPGLQIDEHEALEDVVVEDEIDVVVRAIDRDALLAADETEAAPEFEEEGLELIDQCLFEFGLDADRPVWKPEEFEHVRISQHVSWCGLNRRDQVGTRRLVLGESAFVVAGRDLTIEFARAPPSCDRFGVISAPGSRVVYSNESPIMRPRQCDVDNDTPGRRFVTRRVTNLEPAEELQHVAEVARVIPLTKLAGELPRQHSHQIGAI